MHPSLRHLRYGVSLALMGAVLLRPVASAGNTLSPGHPVWESAGIDKGALATALLQLRERQLKQPRTRGAHFAADSGDDKWSTGSRARFLVLPVLYADGPQEGPVPREEIEARFFDPRRADSFHSWWRRASGGVFAPEGRVLPWLRLQGPKSRYLNVVNGSPRFSATRLMAEEAVCLAAPQLGDWWDYDNDGPDGLPGSGDDDGILDFVIVLHPDPGIEILVEENGIVALQDRMDRDAVLANCELGADPFVVASVFDPLGVWVHESGHLLGLVDLYDLEVPADETEEGRAVGGLGLWSLMATGTWGAGGKEPTDLDAYSRWLLGWNAMQDHVPGEDGFPLDIGADRTLHTLWPVLDWGRERFLLEARSPASADGIDAALPGEGVLIYRVDESAQDCRRPEALRLVELLQADGLRDLEELRNEGDAGDPYTGSTGADELGPNTVPDSYSREPGPSKLPPRIAVTTNPSVPGWIADLRTQPVSSLILREARFGDGRVGLAAGESGAWFPGFELAGGELVGLPRLRVTALSGGLSASTLDWIALRAIPGSDPLAYELADTLVLAVDAVAMGPDAGLELELEVDGRAQALELGIPVGAATGIPANGFDGWTPIVVSAGNPATEFVGLGAAAVPDGADPGWAVRTASSAAYGNCAELLLESPWIAPAVQDADTLVFWSRFHTESSGPGEAWDGGIVEIQWPGGGWRPLSPAGRDVVRIRPLSNAGAGTAASGGALGLGGGPKPWSLYRAAYPVMPMPYRVRFRFGSDASVVPQDAAGGWSLAGAEVGTTAPSSPELMLRDMGGGRMEAVFRAQPSEVDSVSLHWRQAPRTTWTLLVPASALDDSGEARYLFEIPEAAYFEVGAFEGSSSETLLARNGWRRSGAPGLRVFPNPSAGLVNFRATVSGSERELHIHDVRGRRVRVLRFPAQLTVVSWDGHDDAGHRVASGLYFARLQGGGAAPVNSFVIVR